VEKGKRIRKGLIFLRGYAFLDPVKRWMLSA